MDKLIPTIVLFLAGCLANGAEPAPNLVKNGDFEETAPNDPTLPAGWSRRQSTSKTAYRDPTQAQSGKAALVVKNQDDASAGWQGIQQAVPCAPSTYYQISLWGKTQGEVKGQLQIIRGGKAPAANFFFSSANWRKFTYVVCSAAEPGGTLQLTFMPWPWGFAGGMIGLDDVVVTPITTTAQVSELIENQTLDPATAGKILQALLARPPAELDREQAKALLAREKLKAEITLQQKAVAFQITSASNEIETLLDFAEFDLDELKGKLPADEAERARRQLSELRQTLAAKVADFSNKAIAPHPCNFWRYDG
ncbi:MAG: hypothetical protein PHV34_11840 [Verrucomicrobiae bacterium]|nr:hypothetical protein [Verrucomicrobiae bacterium]